MPLTSLQPPSPRVLHRKPPVPKALGMPLSAPRPIDPRLFAVTEHVLPNGLSVRVLEDRGVPSVSLYTFFRVGSRNERPGRTGIAHLFEHMMFNGAARYGPKEFDRVLESNGGHSNAFTSQDMTAYYEDVAAEALEIVLDLESDRMRSLAITPEMFASEREVVKEERRLSVENESLGVLDEELMALAYQAHPYRWPVIGWMADIEAIQREDCLDFFRTYYAPNNASLWIVGDVKTDEVLGLVERYYGDIPRGPTPLPAASTEPAQRGERRGWVRFPSHSEAIAVGYKAPAAASPDAVVLDVIQYALTAGDGARLNRKLIFDQLLAANVFVDYAWRIDLGLFLVILELNPGVKAERALKALDQELARVVTKGLSERELWRAKGMLRSQHLREIASNNGRAHVLGTHELLLGDWRRALEVLEHYSAVDDAEVRRVAEATFRAESRSVVTLVPTAGEGAGHD